MTPTEAAARLAQIAASEPDFRKRMEYLEILGALADAAGFHTDAETARTAVLNLRLSEDLQAQLFNPALQPSP